MWSSYCHKVILHSEKISLRGLKVSLSEKREKLNISPNQKVHSLWMSSVPWVVAVETQSSFQCWCWWYECPELFWALPICQVTCFPYATLSQQQPFKMAAVMIPVYRWGSPGLEKFAAPRLHSAHTRTSRQWPVSNTGPWGSWSLLLSTLGGELRCEFTVAWSLLLSTPGGSWDASSPLPSVLKTKGLADSECLNNVALLCQGFIFITLILHIAIEQFP